MWQAYTGLRMMDDKMQDTKQKIDIYHISGDTRQKNSKSFNEMNVGLDRL